MKLVKTKQSGVQKDHTVFRKVVAAMLAFVTMVLLLSELSTFTLYAVPMIGIQMFQMTGIGIESGLSLAEFSVSDFSVMFMMWVMPCLFFVGISIYAHCKLIRAVCRKLCVWFWIVFARSKSAEKD